MTTNVPNVLSLEVVREAFNLIGTSDWELVMGIHYMQMIYNVL